VNFISLTRISPYLSITIFFVLMFFWISIRAKASDESRTNVGTCLVAISNLALPIIGGIPALSFKTPIGKTEAVFVWLMISLAILEIVLRRSRSPLGDKLKKLINSIIFFWFLGFVYALYQGLALRPNFFYVPVCFVIIGILSPNYSCMKSIFRIMSITISILFILYVTKFEFTTGSSDYIVQEDVSADQLQYQNKLWDILKIRERYSGPFSHPNEMGTYLSLMLLLLIGAKKRQFIPFIFLSSVLLLLTSSRGSILALLISCLMIFTINFRTNFQKTKSLSLSKLLFIPIICVSGSVIFVITRNLTLTGRTGYWSQYLALWKESPIFGKGIALRSVESTFVYNLASLGLIGVILMLQIYRIAFSSLPRIVQRDSVLPVTLFTWIIVRGLTDSIHTFSGWNSATLAFLILGLLSQRKFNLKE